MIDFWFNKSYKTIQVLEICFKRSIWENKIKKKCRYILFRMYFCNKCVTYNYWYNLAIFNRDNHGGQKVINVSYCCYCWFIHLNISSFIMCFHNKHELVYLHIDIAYRCIRFYNRLLLIELKAMYDLLVDAEHKLLLKSISTWCR